MCSPYAKHIVVLKEKIKRIERKISDRLFSLDGDIKYPIFKISNDNFITRIDMGNFIPDNNVCSNAIDGWSSVFNYESSIKSSDFRKRFYFSVGIQVNFLS